MKIAAELETMLKYGYHFGLETLMKTVAEPETDWSEVWL